jgi:hypothetical protein
MGSQTRLLDLEIDEPEPWHPDLKYNQWLKEKFTSRKSES